MTTTTEERVEEVWGQILAAMGGAAAAVLTFLGVWLKVRGDRDRARLTSDGVTEVAKIEADSSERIHMVEVLSARVNRLEEHNTEQDVRIGELITTNAQLRAQNTLLGEQNKLLRRQVDQLTEERAGLLEEIELLREVVQGPISDALEVLDEPEEP